MVSINVRVSDRRLRGNKCTWCFHKIVQIFGKKFNNLTAVIKDGNKKRHFEIRLLSFLYVRGKVSNKTCQFFIC